MKIIQLILARGGSKGIPKKNIKLLAGKPLIQYAIEEAKKVKLPLYVSTEDKEIKQIVDNLGVSVLDRPILLAQDESKSIDTVKYHLKKLRALEGKFHAILLINACMPFLKLEDMQACVDIFEKQKCDSVVSLVEDFSSHPSKICCLIENKVYPFQTGYSFQTGERQKLTKVYKRNTALYLAKTAVIKKGSFFGTKNYGYIMPVERSLDINSMWDFKICELILKNETNL